MWCLPAQTYHPPLRFSCMGRTPSNGEGGGGGARLVSVRMQVLAEESRCARMARSNEYATSVRAECVYAV